MANSFKLPSSLIISQAPMVDKDGKATFAFLKLFQGMYASIVNAFNAEGQLISEISAQAVISGRTEGIGTTVGNLNDTGVITPPGLIPASDTAQGAVILPAGSTSNVLGSASQANASDFDPAGSAATAQSNAETFAAAAASAAQGNAEAFASNATNLSSGQIDVALLPGLSVTVVTAALTTGGTQGSMVFTNGVLTAQTPAT